MHMLPLLLGVQTMWTMGLTLGVMGLLGGTQIIQYY